MELFFEILGAFASAATIISLVLQIRWEYKHTTDDEGNRKRPAATDLF